MGYPALAITFKPTPRSKENITWKRALVPELGDFGDNCMVAYDRMQEVYPYARVLKFERTEVGPGISAE